MKVRLSNKRRHPSGGFGAHPGRHEHNGEAAAVRAWTEELVIPTYLPKPPDKNPMFLEKRVYQGSSGKVYPLPFTDRVSETKVDHKWMGVWLENKYLRVLVLPEIGGRIHSIEDKTNGYDIIYRQTVIKPALVGLAGPWISGGIEFNWPQHHRPATFLPVDFHIEQGADGSQTVWCSDHDPMARMKGMHGVCLHPGRAYLELKVRAYNRTPYAQTFLWWANVATRVHEGYQSFFPPDVQYVADHARRAVSDYPLCNGFYYGVDYGKRGRIGVPDNERPAQFIPPSKQLPDGVRCESNDLSWYANIATPCSYMCLGSKEDFFGGYDHFKQAGIVHIANHHISPGKKQWTWGNQEFGYAWDRNLTDSDGPYVELMAGVYTDNQPDFSFLQPGETKSWSQYWYPIQKIGPAHHANIDAAASLAIVPAGDGLKGNSDRVARLGVCVSSAFRNARVTLTTTGPKSKVLASFTEDLAPGAPLVKEVPLNMSVSKADLELRVCDQAGLEILGYSPKPGIRSKVPPPATEPPEPEVIKSGDELYLAGLHLEQYRHATRCPTIYWREALRRDPLDARGNNALGRWHFRRGEFSEAESHFRKAIERLTSRNANPYDGEAYYNLGLCLRSQLDARPEPGNEISEKLFADAYAAFYKASWNLAWVAASYHALAELDCRRGDWTTALAHLDHSLRFDTENFRACNLRAIVLRRLGRETKADAVLKEVIATDPLDWWARHLLGQDVTCDNQACLDIAHDFSRAGFNDEAVSLLETRVHGDLHPVNGAARNGESKADSAIPLLPNQNWGTGPLLHYTLGWFQEKLGRSNAALAEYNRGGKESPDYCFPARLEEIAVLECAMRANPQDARAPYYIGNLLYDRRRHAEAVRLWERSAKLDPAFSTVWRNLGIAYFNILKQPKKARAAYDRAFAANPTDARLLHERDQLWKRTGTSPPVRLRKLEKYAELVSQRDDLSVELCALYNLAEQPQKALTLLTTRKFQPWEGGEGQALGQYTTAHLALGRRAMVSGDAGRARRHFESALEPPQNLGEARHPLANQSDIHYWLGIACAALGEGIAAKKHWTAAATFRGDFQEMSVRHFSELTYYSAMALQRLGRNDKAKRLLKDLMAYARRLQKTPARIDYFATSLPLMLIFEDDIQCRQERTALFLQAQAWLGLGNRKRAKSLLTRIIKCDPSHSLAAGLMEELGSGQTASDHGFGVRKKERAADAADRLTVKASTSDLKSVASKTND
jgi:tetratricopeptide (TPR) repeat protein